MQPLPPTPMTEMGEQLRPTRALTGETTMPRSPRISARGPPELAYDRVSALILRVSLSTTYSLDLVAALDRTSVAATGRAGRGGCGGNGDCLGRSSSPWKRGRSGRCSRKDDEEEKDGEDGLSRASEHLDLLFERRNSVKRM